MFHIGQRVVCVDEPPDVGGVSLPRRGGVYTIRETYVDRTWDTGDLVDGVLLVEIVNSPDRRCGYVEPGFQARRFRPVDETRLEVFRQMLAPAPRVKEPA